MTIRVHHPQAPFDTLLHSLGILLSQEIPNVLDIELALDRSSVTLPDEEPSTSNGLILLLPGLQKSRRVGSLILEDTQPMNFSGTILRFILETLPTIHTLTLEQFELTESTLCGLIRPVDPEAPPDKQPRFPAFEVLRLHYSRIMDNDAFKLMIESHPIRQLHIWGCAPQLYEKHTTSLRDWLFERALKVYITEQ